MTMLNDAVYLASYKGPAEKFLHRVTHKLITKLTGSMYSHCELVINGVGYSSSERDGGVRAKSMYFPSTNWDIRPLPWVDHRSILDFYDRTKEDSYDFWGLRLFLGLADPEGDDKLKWWCSEWCAAAVGLYDTRVSPGRMDIWARARYHTMLKEVAAANELRRSLYE